MNHSDIEHMAQGFPPSSTGKDHEEVVIELANSLLSAQQKLDATEAKLEAGKAVKASWQNRAWTAEEELERYSMEPGRADQYACEAKAMRVALGFTADAVDVAPVDLVERINQQRAEGVIMFASKPLAAAGDLESKVTLERLMLDAEEFAGQLRAGKDGV